MWVKILTLPQSCGKQAIGIALFGFFQHSLSEEIFINFFWVWIRLVWGLWYNADAFVFFVPFFHVDTHAKQWAQLRSNFVLWHGNVATKIAFSFAKYVMVNGKCVEFGQ